jgi:DNA-binding response OmpR family regulator
MVVDDDVGIRHAVAKVLREDGHEIVEEADGKSALRHFAGDPVDLVVSDVFMPDMDGIEFLMRLRGAFPQVKILMMSGGGILPAKAVLDASAALGANRVIAKPFSSAEVRDAIRALLNDGA